MINLNNAKHVGYINHRIYTDVETWKIFELNGKLYAQTCVKEPTIKPDYIPGGFSAICLNNSELYHTGNYKEVLKYEPFEIVKRRGKYGKWIRDCWWSHDVEAFFHVQVEKWRRGEDVPENAVVEFEKDVDGKEYANCYGLTPSGKYKKVFKILGDKIVDSNGYYYDHNF